jgi:cysteine desulfuration protein SufE
MPTQTEKEIIETFELFDDPMDRYEQIIEIGNELPPMDEKYKTDDYIVKGCQSKVWLRAFKENDKIYFQADSNTVITKGIIALLVKVLSGNSAEEIIHHKLEFIDAIGLRGHLSSQRSNGLTAMIGKMKEYAANL